jgi:hypothetical protein
MSKLFLIFFVLLTVLAVSVIADEDEYFGLSVGMETGIGNINKVNGGDLEPYHKPMIIFDRSFLDGALDVFAELDYTFKFNKVYDLREYVYPQSLYFDLLFAYNMGLGSATTLTFIFENEFDEFIIAPAFKDSNNVTGILTPAIKMNQKFDFGDIYTKIGFPVTYFQEDKNAKTIVDLYFTLGWYSIFGLGLEAKVLMQLLPDRGNIGFDALASYETDDIYFEVLAEVPADIKTEGITITPRLEYYYKRVTFFTYFEFSGMGVDEGKVSVSPALGIKFSF